MQYSIAFFLSGSCTWLLTRQMKVIYRKKLAFSLAKRKAALRPKCEKLIKLIILKCKYSHQSAFRCSQKPKLKVHGRPPSGPLTRLTVMTSIAHVSPQKTPIPSVDLFVSEKTVATFAFSKQLPVLTLGHSLLLRSRYWNAKVIK